MQPIMRISSPITYRGEHHSELVEKVPGLDVRGKTPISGFREERLGIAVDAKQRAVSTRAQGKLDTRKCSFHTRGGRCRRLIRKLERLSERPSGVISGWNNEAETRPDSNALFCQRESFDLPVLDCFRINQEPTLRTQIAGALKAT
eukprot:1187386-Prorocentrum_minimum.AAC.3